MAAHSTPTQLTTVEQVQDAARLLMQPRSSRRTSRVPAIQTLKRILLPEQQLTREFGIELFPFISFSTVSTSLTVLDLSFNELDDNFWLNWTPDLRRAAWPALTTLNLANNQFTGRGLVEVAAFIARCPSLTQLDLSLNLLSDKSSSPDWIRPLINALDDKGRGRLQVLDMSCTGVADFDIEQILQSEFVKSITKFYLRSNVLTDEAAIAFGDALPKMKVEVLSLAGNLIGNCGAASLAFVMDQVPALQTFDLEENQIGSDGITSFFHSINGMIAPFPLRYLHLGGNLFASKTVLEQIHTKLHEKIIETQLSAGPAAALLNISGNKVKRDILLECCLTDRYVHVVTQTLRASPNWQLLEVLDMSGNEIGEKGAYDVGLFLALQPQLRVLNLSNNLITDTAILGLAEGLEPNAKLQELLLDHNQITDAGAKQLYLKAFKANQQRRIKLSVGNPLTSECKVMLAAISQAHDLRKRFTKEFASQEKLELSGRALRQYGAAAIAEELAATPNSKCRIIDFSRNGLGDEGAQAIAQLLRAYPLLEELDLSFNDIGDDGVILLADALSENATLMSLSLHSALEGSQVKPKLQEKGLCYLAQAIQGRKALVKLDLRNNVTSPAVIRAYVEMLRRNQGIQKFNGTSAAVFLSSHTIWITMTNFRRFLRRAYRFCVSFQVELRGHYSPERIGNFDDYCCKTSAIWSFIVCVLSPFPCLLIVAALDCVPMAPPKEGSEANYLFWIRDCLAITLMTRAILEQFRVSVPGLHINAVHVIVMPIIAGGCAVLFMTAMSSVIGFPLPFALVVGIPVWFVVVVICFACCFGQKLRRDPVLFKDLQNSIVVLIFQVLLTFVYPAYLYGFNRVKASNQKFYLVLLPIIKIIAKNLISHNLGTKYDLMPQIMIFNVDVFNALYVSSTMQSSNSISTMMSMVGLDVFQAWVSISDIERLMNCMTQLQCRIPAEHPLKSASFIQIAQQIIKEDSHARANLLLQRYNSAFSILKYPARGSVGSLGSVGASADTIQTASKKILPVDTTGAPLPVAEVETFTPLHHDESTQRCGVLEDVLSPRERRLFVQRTAQVLFTTEFVILVEYTEVIVPFIFCIYTLSMYYLPNQAYYPQLAALDESGLRSKLSTVTMFGAVELLSLLVYGFIIQRKIGVSMLRMLSFVLERGWRMVQSNLFLWIFYTVQNSLEHNGADFSWSFTWLKEKDT